MRRLRTDDGSATVPWRSATVQVVLLSTLLAPLGVPLISPALPVIRDALGLTDASASLLISAYFATGIVLSPFIGLLADRVGRRRVLLTSLFVFSLTGPLVALRPGFLAILLIRVVQGTAAAGIFITTVTLVGDRFEGRQRNAVLGANTAVLSVGAAVYPLVGGALAGISWSTPFLVYLVGLPVGLVAVWRLREPTVERDTRTLRYFRRVAGALAGREAGVLYGTSFAIETILFGGVITVLPFLLFAAYELSPVQIGLVLTAAEVSAAVVATQNGRLAGYLSDYGIIGLGFGSAGVGLVGAWLAPTAVLVALASVVIGASWGLTLPSVDAALTDLVPGRFRAGALSLRNSTTFLGRTTGPILFVGVAAVTGYQVLLLAAGAASLLVGGLVVALTRSATAG